MKNIKTIFIILIYLTISGCSIDQNELAEAEKICSEHEGTYELSPHSDYIDVYCKDGTYVTGVTGKTK